MRLPAKCSVQPLSMVAMGPRVGLPTLMDDSHKLWQEEALSFQVGQPRLRSWNWERRTLSAELSATAVACPRSSAPI